MKKIIAFLIFSTALLLSVPVFGESLQGEGGWREYDREESKEANVQTTPRMNSDLVRKKAETGDADAQYILGYMYRTGEGVPQDYTRAAEWTRKAADQGHAEAQYNLGVMYINGHGVPRDDTNAAKWTRKAAEQGYPLALCNIGEMYATGQGVRRDFFQAYFWSGLAASRASGDASRHAADIRDQVAKQLPPEKLKEAQRMTREWEKSHPAR